MSHIATRRRRRISQAMILFYLDFTCRHNSLYMASFSSPRNLNVSQFSSALSSGNTIGFITVFRIEEFSSFLIRDGIGDIVEVHLSNVRTAHEIDKSFCVFFILCVFRDDPRSSIHMLLPSFGMTYSRSGFSS